MADLICVNAWFFYNRDATKEDNVPFLDFKTGIVQGLLKAFKPSTPQGNKGGRPKNSSLERQYKEKCKKGPAAVIHTSDIRLDEIGHFPKFEAKKGRCKKPGCKGTPKVKCTKCNLTPSSNCF